MLSSHYFRLIRSLYIKWNEMPFAKVVFSALFRSLLTRFFRIVDKGTWLCVVLELCGVPATLSCEMENVLLF